MTTMMNTTSSGNRLGLSALSTQAAFTLTVGRKAVTKTSDGLPLTINDGTNTHRVNLMNRFRGLDIGFGGTGADNSTANYRVWLVYLGYAATSQFPSGDPLTAVDAMVVPYIADTSTITLSTLVGVTGDAGVYTSSQRIADTLTATLATTATTPAGIGSVLETARQLGVATAYSPSLNAGAARLIIPDLGGADGFLVEFDLTGATGIMYDYRLTL